MEQLVIEYLANALWQLPVLALGAWLLLRVWMPGPAMQHRVWLAVLALGLLLPLRGVMSPVQPQATPSASSVNGPTVAAAALQQAPSLAVDTASVPTATGNSSGWAVFADLGVFLHRVSVSAVALNWILGLWLAVALWGLARLAIAWRSARRLVTDSREAALGEREREALCDCARRIGVEAPEIRESNTLAGPVVVGAAKPILLWPEGFAQFSEEELRAAFCHELAHVRRRDYGMNLLCEAAALPLKWHPVTHAVERQIRATREMACDAIAAEAMDSEMVYAECLVRLARSIAEGGLAETTVAAGLFHGNVMEERVMRFMRAKSAMSMRAKVARGAAGAAAMIAAIALAGAFHVTPAMAQQNAQGPVPPAPPVQAAPSAQIDTPLPPSPPARPPAAFKAPPPLPPEPQTPVVAPPRLPAAPPRLPAAPPRAHHLKPAATLNGQRELTPAEKARIEKQLAKAQERGAEATAKINSPEFRKKIQDEIDAASKVNSAEFQQRMADARKQINAMTAKLNSPEFRKKIQDEIDAASEVNSAEFQKQMTDAQKQIADATARLNSPEFRKQIQNAVDAAARVNSAEFQKQMADAQKQIADAMARLKAEQQKNAAK